MRSRRGAKLLLAVLGTLAALLIAEGLVRALGLAPRLAAIEVDEPHASFISSPDPILKYVPKPGAGDINSAGFRGREYERGKPPGTVRIVVVGDSIGFGYCNEKEVIPVDRTFAGVLELRLDREGLDGAEQVEVLNLSVSGYDTLQEAEFLRRVGLAYAPDVVIVAYCLNDVMLASRELHLFGKAEGWQAYREAADMVYRGAIFRSHLVRLVWQRVPRLAARVAGGDAPDDPAPGIERSIEGFRRIAEMAAENGFRVVVAVFPFFRDFERYPYGPLHASVTNEARRQGLEVVDLLPAFAAASAKTTDLCVPCCDIHPNERGHALAARVLAERLRRPATD